MKQTRLLTVAVFALCMSFAMADDIGGPDKILRQSPTDLGYANVPNWLKFPPPQHPDWEFDGVVAGVGVDSQGRVYVSHRGKKTPKLTVWNPDGSFRRVFPGPIPTRPHMVNIDQFDNVWLVDDGGHCIRKMDQQGEVSLTLGEPGVKGFDDHYYNHPTDIGWDRDGNLYMTDGDNSEKTSRNRRVLKYTKDGKFIKKWGSIGQGVGQFDYPHSILVDSEETVFVCDRNNWRIQVFDKHGQQEANRTHIGRVYKIVQDKNGDYFVSDGKVGRITKFKRDGTVIGFFETPDKGPGERGSLNNAHSLAICPNGDLITGTYQGWVERWRAPKPGEAEKPGKWTPLSCAGQPDGRHETSFVECRGKFYLIGGRESRKIDCFNPVTKTWTKMQAQSPLIHHFQPVLWHNKVYIAAGSPVRGGGRTQTIEMFSY